MKIKAIVELIPRERHECPNDGVHRAGANGEIKGVHSLIFKQEDKPDKLVPKGQVSMYWQISENEGIKIFFSFGWLKGQKIDYVKRILKKHHKLHQLGICPYPKNIKWVFLNLIYRKNLVKTKVPAYYVDHCYYPEKAWSDYAKGRPYDWDCLDKELHPQHNPEGYKSFVKRAKMKLAMEGIKIHGSWKLGDVVYCQRNKRWYLVDVD